MGWREEYAAEMRMRSTAMRAEKRRRGEFGGGEVPFGFVIGPDGRQLVANDAEQAVLSRIRELRTQGVTYRTIAEVLNVDGFRTRRGKPFELWQVFHYARRSLVTL